MTKIADLDAGSGGGVGHAQEHETHCVQPGSFEPERHFYPKALRAEIHPDVQRFLAMSGAELGARYLERNPGVDANVLTSLIEYQPRHFTWSGADLFPVAHGNGRRSMVVVEINSCPSGQKSVPMTPGEDPTRGYRRLIERTFLPMASARSLPRGGLAVIHDKNFMEASGYAAAMAEVTGEAVLLARFSAGVKDPSVRFTNDVMHIRDPEGSWRPIRAAFRYVTQQPWDRIPVRTHTAILNPVIACLAGGRNKLLAAKAYADFNKGLQKSGLEICSPETRFVRSKAEVPACVVALGGMAVIKVPYSNAGQGVYTIMSAHELKLFMDQPHTYEHFIVQSLIGHSRWSTGEAAYLSHLPMQLPGDERAFVADLRMMISAGREGFEPLALYGRRARTPLTAEVPAADGSWEMLGTNLSVRRSDGTWDTESERLLVMDRETFPCLALSIDDLVEAYVQTVLSTVAVDRRAATIGVKKSEFTPPGRVNTDPALLLEIARASAPGRG